MDPLDTEAVFDPPILAEGEESDPELKADVVFDADVWPLDTDEDEKLKEELKSVAVLRSPVMDVGIPVWPLDTDAEVPAWLRDVVKSELDASSEPEALVWMEDVKVNVGVKEESRPGLDPVEWLERVDQEFEDPPAQP